MEKAVVFLYNDPDDIPRLLHHFLYINDLVERGVFTKVVLEGPSVRIPGLYSKSDHKLNEQYKEIKPMIDAVCMGCAKMMRVADEVEAEGLPLVGDLKGHVGLPKYLEEGFDLITF